MIGARPLSALAIGFRGWRLHGCRFCTGFARARPLHAWSPQILTSIPQWSRLTPATWLASRGTPRVRRFARSNQWMSPRGQPKERRGLTKNQLMKNRGTSVDDYRFDAGAVAELAGLLVDLASELACRGEDEGKWHGLACTPSLELVVRQQHTPMLTYNATGVFSLVLGLLPSAFSS